MDDNLDQFDQAKYLYEHYDELVKTEMRGIAIVDELQGHHAIVDLLVDEAKQGFLEAVSTLLSGELDLFTEKGIAKVAQAQEALKRYRNMLSWIGETVAKARDARDEKHQLEAEMELLYDDERTRGSG